VGGGDVVDMLRVFAFPPGPEGVGDGFVFVRDSEGDTAQQSTVFPGAWLLTQGVAQVDEPDVALVGNTVGSAVDALRSGCPLLGG